MSVEEEATAGAAGDKTWLLELPSRHHLASGPSPTDGAPHYPAKRKQNQNEAHALISQFQLPATDVHLDGMNTVLPKNPGA
jgi:hypothetical protein